MAPNSALRGATYLLNFGLARGALFGAPLLLANLLATQDYGQLEMALATASLLASTATLGTASVVPLVLLRDERNATLAGIIVHHLGVVVICALVGLMAGAVGAGSSWSFAALLTATLALQSLGSTHLKTLGHSDQSVMLDAGLFGLMAVSALLASLTGLVSPRQVIWWMTALYCTALFVYYSHSASRLRAESLQINWFAAIRAGLPLMLGGIVSMLVTTSGRLGTGLLAGPAMTADYAALARATALPIVMHQVILIAKFRHLFTASDREVERATTTVVCLVGLSAVGFWIFSPWLSLPLGSAFSRAWQNHHLPALWILSQSVLWSAIALNDLVITRHQLMARLLPVTGGGLLLALGLGWLALRYTGVTLENFVFTHGLIMLAFYLIQSGVMHAHKIRAWRTWSCAVGAYVLLIGLAYLLN